MPASTIRLGVNGFGRIGRCVTRIAAEDPCFQIVAINDLVEDVGNFVYLYNYDSTYGRARERASVGEEPNTLRLAGDTVRFSHGKRTVDVPWEEFGVDVVVDATGVTENVAGSRQLVDAGRVAKVLITHSPERGVDRYVIMGVNDHEIDLDTDHVFSTTICDANAIAHPLLALDQEFGVESGFVTTLHPWLSYQNLVDGPVEWQSVPGSYWKDFSLGRSSVATLIPKNTTAVSTLHPILPEIEARLSGLSFRTPTSIVSSADLSLKLGRDTSAGELGDYLRQRFAASPYVMVSDEALVGIDFAGEPYSAVIDSRWLQVLPGGMVKLVLWYDNEWGYSSRVLDLARTVTGR